MVSPATLQTPRSQKQQGKLHGHILRYSFTSLQKRPSKQISKTKTPTHVVVSGLNKNF